MAELLNLLARQGGGFNTGGYSPNQPNPYQPRNPNQLNQLANQFSRNLQTMRQRVPQWTPQPNPTVRTVPSQPDWMTQPTSQFLAPAAQTTMQQPTAPAVGPSRSVFTGDMPVPTRPPTGPYASPPVTEVTGQIPASQSFVGGPSRQNFQQRFTGQGDRPPGTQLSPSELIPPGQD